MNEDETRAQLIDPALERAGWIGDLVGREVRVSEGRLYLVGDQTHQREPTSADYVLYRGPVPIASIEAKDESHPAGAGLQQAKAYAELLDVSLAYSSNGHGFVEFDYETNIERSFGMADFPRPSDLAKRLEASGDLPTASGDPLYYPYDASSGLFPRYYQDVAIRRTLEAMNDGAKRVLLAMATGTGKTFIAAQLAWKLYRTKRVRRCLFLSDRVFLRDQAFNDFAFFASGSGDPRHVVEGEMPTHADLYFAIYQALYSGTAGQQLFRSVPEDFFDLIIVDECHRSGFGTWREILDYFGSAVHLGLTATPKRTDNIDTYAYFGDPVYMYSLGQGIQDGYLATYKVHRVATNLNDAGGVDVEDALVAGADLYVPEGVEDIKSFYTVGEFERRITLPDWTDRICDHLASTLAATGGLEKTVVFCVNMDHALQVRQRLQNHFAHLGLADFAVRIVSEEAYAASLLEKFRASTGKTPCVVTTVDLLSTGVDIPSLRNVVFMKPIGSVVLFKQIVGRGSRLDPVIDKTWFRIIDYTNATRLFDEWDRPPGEPTGLPEGPWECEVRVIALDADTGSRVENAWAIAVAAPNVQVSFTPEEGELVATGLPASSISVHLGAPGYGSRQVKVDASLQAGPVSIELRPLQDRVERIVLSGLQVEIASEVVLTVDATGQQMSVPEYLAYAKGAILELVPDQGELTTRWIDEDMRIGFVSELERRGIHLGLVADLERVHDADEHDVASFLAFDTRPLSRRAERVEAFLNRNHHWLEGMSERQKAIAQELVRTYLDGGVSQLQRSVLKLERFQPFGGTVGVIGEFGGTEGFDQVLRDITTRLYLPEGEAA